MHGGDAAVSFYAGFEFHQHRMASAVAVETLFASKTNLYGTVENERGFRYHDFVIERIALPAEPSAIGSGNNANVRGRHLQDFSECAVQIVRSLRAGPDGELAVGIFRGDRCVLLDGQMCVALIKESVFEDFVGFGETLIDVAKFERHAFVDVAFVAVIVNARRWRR